MKPIVKLAIGIGAGLLAGTALGLLFAPAKGSDSRRKVSRQVGTILNGLSERAGDLKRKVSPVRDEYQQSGQETE